MADQATTLSIKYFHSKDRKENTSFLFFSWILNSSQQAYHHVQKGKLWFHHMPWPLETKDNDNKLLYHDPSPNQ